MLPLIKPKMSFYVYSARSEGVKLHKIVNEVDRIVLGASHEVKYLNFCQKGNGTGLGFVCKKKVYKFVV